MTRLMGISVLVLVLAPLSLLALSAIDVSEEQLAKKADMIVIGRVLSAYCEKATSTNDVYTFITVRITDQIKGKSPSRDIVLKTAGGRVGTDIVYYPGAADFFRNEEVFLFLERRTDKTLMPIGMMLGKYSIYRESETGKQIVYRHTDGNGQYFSSSRPDTVLVERGPKLFLSDFRDRIRKAVGEGR